MDKLRRPPAAVPWISAEPLIEDISQDINVDGFHWVVWGGDSGKSKVEIEGSQLDVRQEQNPAC
jgi:protein gp37